MASHNQYTSQASYQLYDTSGSTEDWSYWITGGLGFTFEIGPDGFHPEYEDAVVGEYLGVQPAAGAGEGGNREAYYTAAPRRAMARAPLADRRHCAEGPHDHGHQDPHLPHLAGDPARRVDA